MTIHREPVGVMGTTSHILAAIPRSDAASGGRILDAAERELRRVEATFSTWIATSEMSRLNAAPRGTIRLSPPVVELLDLARRLHDVTDGAFDVTSGPLIESWREGVAAGRAPSGETLASARRSSSWSDVVVLPEGIKKLRDTVVFDVDGIAKGYAIDRAVEALLRAGAIAGMVEVGGDLRIDGALSEADATPLNARLVALRSPFSNRVVARMDPGFRAVATSGGYARPLVIAGRTFSHILDPRDGRPADGPASVTVVAPRAAEADAWATALSVLGERGLQELEDAPAVEALLIFGTEDDPYAVATGGFPELDGSSCLPLVRAPRPHQPPATPAATVRSHE